MVKQTPALPSFLITSIVRLNAPGVRRKSSCSWAFAPSSDTPRLMFACFITSMWGSETHRPLVRIEVAIGDRANFSSSTSKSFLMNGSPPVIVILKTPTSTHLSSNSSQNDIGCTSGACSDLDDTLQWWHTSLQRRVIHASTKEGTERH